MKPIARTVLLLFLFLLAGCTRRNHSPEQQSGSDPTKKPRSNYPVELLDESGFQKLIRERNGKKLILNVWATWCLPCVEEFPDLVKLSTSLDANYEIAGISVDDPDEIESKVVPFLKKNNPPFKIFVSNFKKQDDLINALNSKWNGAIPATFIYDSTGSQRTYFIGSRSLKQFENEIQKADLLPFKKN